MPGTHVDKARAWDRNDKKNQEIALLRAALETSICPTAPVMVQDCIARGHCGCDNRVALGYSDQLKPEE